MLTPMSQDESLVETLAESTILGNTPWQLTMAAIILVGLSLALLLVRRVIRARYATLAATPQIELMETPLHAASRTTTTFIILLSLYIAAHTLNLDVRVERALTTLFTISVFWQVGLWATVAVLGMLENRRRTTLAANPAAGSSIGILGFLARFTIWSFVLLLTLDNLGVEIKSLLAGLGIGGIAVALAAQNILGDLFASLSITLDRPFVVGDSLTVDTYSGTVEYIGIKSTRLRAPSGEQIIMPNASLLSSRVRNNTRMSQRRVVLTLGVDQSASAEVLQSLPERIRTLVKSHKPVRFDRAHFAKINANSYDFEVVYFVLTADFARHMDIQQSINLGLVQMLQELGLEYSSPQKVFVDSPVKYQAQALPEDP